MAVKTYAQLKKLEAENRIFLDFFVYLAEVNTLNAGATLGDIINVQADSDFILDKLAFFADLAGAAQTAANLVIPLVNLTILDSGSGRNLLDAPTPITSIAGTGELPFVLPQPRVFSANSTIQVGFINYSAVNYTNVRLAFIGRKVFAY